MIIGLVFSNSVGWNTVIMLTLIGTVFVFLMLLSKGLLLVEFSTLDVCNILAVSFKSRHNSVGVSDNAGLIMLKDIFKIRKLSIYQLYIETHYFILFFHIPISINTDFMWLTSEFYIGEIKKNYSQRSYGVC